MRSRSLSTVLDRVERKEARSVPGLTAEPKGCPGGIRKGARNSRAMRGAAQQPEAGQPRSERTGSGVRPGAAHRPLPVNGRGHWGGGC